MLSQEEIYKLAVWRYGDMQKNAPGRNPYTDPLAIMDITEFNTLCRVLEADQSMIDKIAVESGYPIKKKP